MNINETTKKAVLNAIKSDFKRKKKADASQNKARHANSLGINPSVYSRLMNGEVDRLLSGGEWVRIGMQLCVDMNGLNWQMADTATTSKMWAQMEYCRANGMSAIFCDDKGLGKTYTAKQFALQYPNVAFVDCSRNHTKRELIRAVARGFGLDYRSKLSEVKKGLVDNILTLDQPLLILDEAGDLNYQAFLEIKSLWNSLEFMCGFYMMGANGLKAKIDRNIRNYKVGYEEVFDRFGDRYQHLTKDMEEGEKTAFKRHQAQSVLRANLPDINQKTETKLLNACGLNLRRLRIEIIKYKNQSS